MKNPIQPIELVEDSPGFQLTERGWITLLLSTLTALGISDLVGDFQEGALGWHIAFETLIFGLAFIASLWMGRSYFKLRSQLRESHFNLRSERHSLIQARDDCARWQREAADLMEGLGRAIDKQFEQWKLTASEREVGLLILKGLSYKEIAQVRGTTEKTVRAQSMAIMSKADLSGRSELSAFFLEDLLPASGPTPSARPT